MANRTSVYIGIDPGLDGAVAVLDAEGRILACNNTPTLTIKVGRGNRRQYVVAQMVSLLQYYGGAPNAVVGLEFVRAMPDQGVTSMFSMGRGVGLWEGIITALGFPLIQITPQVWKRAMLGPGMGSDKNASILQALALFPTQAPALLTRKKDHNRAEALLIAEYLRRKETYHA